MGTRNVTAVIDNNGDLKIAQYGQWDGYPSSSGLDILDFLRGLDKDKFGEAVSRCSWIDDKRIDNEQVTFKTHPHLSRNTGCDILQNVLDANGLELRDNMDFGIDGLMCEWAYIIDLKNNVLEVYAGFKSSEVGDAGYWKGENDDSGYAPVQKIASYNLDDLPSNEDLIRLDSDEEE